MSQQPEKITLELDRDSAFSLLNALAIAGVRPLEGTCWEPVRTETYRKLLAGLFSPRQPSLQLNSNEFGWLDLL